MTSREVRVFVSSTFRDMRGERDELVTRVFPALRALCESRGVTWGEVDLRWGIAETAEGSMLPVCLAEIGDCRPYFLGLLGERYGVVPDAIDPGLIEQKPWLSENLERSVTELEILHGVLNDPALADHAFFYFRDPAYSEDRPGYRDLPVHDDVAEFGQAEAEARARGRREKLQALKDRIRASGRPVRENFADPGALGELVLADLTGVIERLFPAGSEPDPLERENALHEAFARSRVDNYIGRSEYFERLDAHAAGDGPPVVVLGESGVGKSALSSSWALSWRERHDDLRRLGAGEQSSHVVMHFVAASPGSADWASMLRRILGELDAYFELGLEIPDEPQALRAAFANGLYRAAARGRVVLLIDALNQLEDRDGAPDLVWLPPAIPENVRLVLSTLPGRSLDELSHRGWPTLEVAPLDRDERGRLIAGYLEQDRQTLGPDFVVPIVDAPQTANPLFLRVLLEELRLHGEHETRLGELLAAADVPELYAVILARWERDYERDRPRLVRDAMTLLWAARRGLTEAELRELLGGSGEPMPVAFWAPLRLAAKQALSNRGGLLGFAHDHARAAIERRYLPGERDQRVAHTRLADYFVRQNQNSARKLDELPWQLARAQEWSELSELLATPAITSALESAAPFELRGYWARVEAASPYRMADAYDPVLQDPTRHDSEAWAIASVLFDAGHPAEALTLWQYTAQRDRELRNPDGLSRSLGGQALILQDRGDLDAALALHKEAQGILRELGDPNGLQESLGSQALILRARGDLDGALALYKEQERICRELGNSRGLQASLGHQGGILQDQRDLDGALALYRERERICRELGEPDGLQASLGNQAAILQVRGDLVGALARLKEAERICRELGNRDGLWRSLANQAGILQVRGDLDGALALHKEAERICRELGNPGGLTRSLGDQALILQQRGDLDGALALHKEAERICRELGTGDGLMRSLGDQALILQQRGETDGALALHSEVEQISRELGNPAALATSLINRALLLARMGRVAEAFVLAEEAIPLARQSGPTALTLEVERIADWVRSQR